MTRMIFGGGIADVYMIPDEDGDLRQGGGMPCLFYNAESGGGQYTDLRSLTDQAISSVTTETGSGARAAGMIPPFYGPDGVFEMWVSVNNSPRFRMTAANLGALVAQYVQSLDAHAQQRNPHSTRFQDLQDADVSLGSAATGSTIVRLSNGLWAAGAAVSGGGGGSGVDLTTDQTIGGTKTFNSGSAAKTALVLEPLATGYTADLLVAYSGTDTGQGGVRQRTTYINNEGGLRVIGAKTSSIPFRVKGQTSHTGNLLEVTNSSNVEQMWVDASYRVSAPNVGHSVPFWIKGAVAVGTGTFGWTNDTTVPLRFRSARTRLGTAGSTSTIVDIKVDGVTIFASSGNRPTIASGQTTSGKINTFSTATIPAGSVLTADVTSAGTGAQDLLLQVDLW